MLRDKNTGRIAAILPVSGTHCDLFMIKLYDRPDAAHRDNSFALNC